MAQSYKLYTGQLTALGATPTPLAGAEAFSIREVVIQSAPSNTTNVLVGHATNQFLVLVPGQGLSIPLNNISSIYVKMASGTGTVNWLARD